MAVVDYTSFADIRASLGVDEAEIGDDVISLPIYSNNLDMEVDSISLSLATDHSATKLKPAGSRTGAEVRFMRAMQLFATYVVARQLTVSLPLFSPKEISDGKATMVRYAQNPYAETIKGVKEACETYRSLVIKAQADLKSTAATATSLRPYLSVVSPTSDPIAGT